MDGDAALTPPDSTILALASGSEVYFARQKPGADYADGLLAGRLSLDQGGCLRMKESSGGSHVLVWPAKFEPGTTGEGGRDVEVLDGQGRAVARVGEKATLGGGEVSGSLEGFSAVDDRTARELRDRCPGNYWLVSEYSE